MCTTENSEFSFCFPPGRRESVSSGSSWPGKHHKPWDGMKIVGGRTPRIGWGWGWACWQVSAVSSSRLLRGNESHPTRQPLNGQCLPRAGSKLAFVEGRKGWLIDQTVLLEKNQPHPGSLSIPGFFFLPTLWCPPPCPNFSGQEFPPTVVKHLRSNLFLIINRGKYQRLIYKSKQVQVFVLKAALIHVLVKFSELIRKEMAEQTRH